MNARGQSTESNEDSAMPTAPVTSTVPPAPTNLTAQAGDRSVTLTWTTPGNGGGTITKHQYREKIGSGAFGNWMNIPNSTEGQTNANSYTVPDLTNGITYTYKVRAVNAQGESTESNEDSARPTATVTSTVPPAPTNLTAQASDRSVTLTWTTPGNGGSAITKHQYREKVRTDDFGNWTNISNSAEGQTNANSYTVPNRTNGTIYTYQVRAVNAQGQSTESNEDSATPATVPDAPTNLTARAGSAQITLTWTTPGNGGSAITKHQYQEKVRTGSFGNWTDISNSAEGQTNANSYPVPDLTNGTLYTYQVRAVNAKGESTESNQASATPSLSPMTVTWPEDIKGTQHSSIWTSLTSTPPNPPQISVSGGQPYYTYNIDPNGAPDGLEIDRLGTITGTPTGHGDFIVRVVVQDDGGQGQSVSHNLNITIRPALNVMSIAYKTVEQGKRITPIHLSASGGWDPYTYSISGAPSGISLSNGNRITGSPSQDGTFPITVTVTDDHGNTAEHSFNMSVYSKELAKKFSPILILTEHPTRTNRIVLYPEPVEIMEATSVDGLWFYFDKEGEGHELSYVQYPAFGWSPDLDSQFPLVNFSQNKFAFLPESFTYVGSPPTSALSNTYQVKAHFEYPGNNKESWNNTYTGSGPKRGDHPNFPNTAYVHAFERSDGNVVIRYYYFYPFNDFQNNHEGDWQYINVIVDSFDPNDADLIGVDYKFHGNGLTYSITGERIFNPRTHFVAPAEGETHPVVYVGAGSHGGYPTGGHYPNPGRPGVPLAGDEEMTKDGVVLSTKVEDTPDVAESYDLILLPNPDPDQPNMGLSPEMSWLGTGARWGTLDVSSFGSAERYDESPVGPFHKDSWGMSDSGSSYPHSDVPYAEFQQFPIVQDVSWSGTINLIGDIVVYPGATLTIEAGTIIKSSRKRDIHGLKNASRARHTSPGVDIINYGTITADASEGNSIVFRSDILTPGGWYGIRNYGMLTMRNCVIQDGLVAIEGNGTQTLEDVAFMNNLLAIGIESIADVDAIKGEAIADIQVASSGGRGVQGHSYSLSDAPKGISISNSGSISGTPGESGTFTVGVTVQDIVTVRDTLHGQGEFGLDPIIVYPPQTISAISDFTMHVVEPLTVAEIDDITVVQNNPIDTIQVSASGGWPSYTYTIAGGFAGDADLSINSSGEITGIPTETGDFTVTVSDAKGNTASTSFNVSVVTQLLSIAAIADVIATQNVAITPIQVVASGGSGSYTYWIGSNPPPADAPLPESNPPSGSGLSIDSNGRITGAPTVSSDFRITVAVRAAIVGRAPPTQESRYFTMRVKPRVTVSTIDDISVKISGVQTNSPITPIQVSASGGQTPYAYTLSSNPATGAGLSINSSSGQITGTPTQRGTFTLNVTVTDDHGRTGTGSFSMTVRLIADFNDDGVVDVADHLLFVEVFGLSEGDDGFNADMDLDGDGTIGISDFLIFVDHFGSTA